MDKNGRIELLELLKHDAGQQSKYANARVWRRGPLGKKKHILYLESLDDIRKFAEEFCCKSLVKGFESTIWVRWGKVGEKYDGLVVGPGAVHHNDKFPLSGIDVPTLCLWRNFNIGYQVDEVGKTNAEYVFLPNDSVVNSSSQVGTTLSNVEVAVIFVLVRSR